MTRVGDVHKRAMLDFMLNNPELAHGRIRDLPSGSHNRLEDLKQLFADAINEVGGIRVKTAAEAFRAWNYWKGTVLKKRSQQIAHAKGTGGGEPMYVVYTPLEEELLQFLGPDACGMQDVPEGGFPSSNQSVALSDRYGYAAPRKTITHAMPPVVKKNVRIVQTYASKAPATPHKMHTSHFYQQNEPRTEGIDYLESNLHDYDDPEDVELWDCLPPLQPQLTVSKSQDFHKNDDDGESSTNLEILTSAHHTTDIPATLVPEHTIPAKRHHHSLTMTTQPLYDQKLNLEHPSLLKKKSVANSYPPTLNTPRNLGLQVALPTVYNSHALPVRASRGLGPNPSKGSVSGDLRPKVVPRADKNSHAQPMIASKGLGQNPLRKTQVKDLGLEVTSHAAYNLHAPSMTASKGLGRNPLRKTEIKDLGLEITSDAAYSPYAPPSTASRSLTHGDLDFEYTGTEFYANDDDSSESFKAAGTLVSETSEPVEPFLISELEGETDTMEDILSYSKETEKKDERNVGEKITNEFPDAPKTIADKLSEPQGTIENMVSKESKTPVTPDGQNEVPSLLFQGERNYKLQLELLEIVKEKFRHESTQMAQLINLLEKITIDIASIKSKME